LNNELRRCCRFCDARDPAKITHDLHTLLAQRIFGIAPGYEGLNDHAALRTNVTVR
jgi:hypothetical protein